MEIASLWLFCQGEGLALLAHAGEVHFNRVARKAAGDVQREGRVQHAQEHAQLAVLHAAAGDAAAALLRTAQEEQRRLPVVQRKGHAVCLDGQGRAVLAGVHAHGQRTAVMLRPGIGQRRQKYVLEGNATASGYVTDERSFALDNAIIIGYDKPNYS